MTGFDNFEYSIRYDTRKYRIRIRIFEYSTNFYIFWVDNYMRPSILFILFWLGTGEGTAEELLNASHQLTKLYFRFFRIDKPKMWFPAAVVLLIASAVVIDSTPNYQSSYHRQQFARNDGMGTCIYV